MKQHRQGYEQGMSNAGAQEVPALRKADKTRRGKDLRSGK